MWRTSTSVLALLSVLALAGCSGTEPAYTVGADGADRVEWGDCEGDLPDGVECADLDVPVDWDEPEGRSITLSLARAPKTGGGPAKGTVVAHFGGPGTAMIPSLKQGLSNFAGLRTHMDLVTWNPRGSSAGDHLPPEKCFPGPRFDPPEDHDEYTALAKRNTAAMRACRDADPEVFDTMDSGTQARDMEAIRAAVGAGKMNYFGNSYGGAVGASYARLYPDRVRTMYLDSSVDQTSPLEETDLGYEAAIEELFVRFTDWCAETSDCALRGRDVEQTWRGLTSRAATTPVPGGSGAALDDDELRILAQNLLIRPAEWPKLSQAVEHAVDGDASLFDPSGNGVPPLPSASAATQCADGMLHRDYADYRRSRERAERRFPDFGGHRAAAASRCAGWPQPVANPLKPLPSGGLPPFLGAAPLFEQRAVRSTVEQVPGSALITYDAPAHGLYLNVGDDCVIAHADRYLTEGTLPPEHTECTPEGPA